MGAVFSWTRHTEIEQALADILLVPRSMCVFIKNPLNKGATSEEYIIFPINLIPIKSQTLWQGGHEWTFVAQEVASACPSLS